MIRTQIRHSTTSPARPAGPTVRDLISKPYRDMRELQRRVPQGTCIIAASDESQADMGVLLLHEEGSMLDRK
jgi:hypothetical protein